jgi:rhamnosyltransferase
MYKIAGIIVLYNPNKEHFSELLMVLRGQVKDIIVVNNAATDPLLKEIFGNISNVHLLQNSANLGVAAAHNLGINWAMDNNFSHVLLLDQDSLPSENMVEKLLEGECNLLGKGVKVGAVGPMYKKIRGSSDYISKSLISSGMLIRIGVLQEIGLMNEKLFIDGIDEDWCYRAQAKGYKTFYVLKATMQHALGQERKLFGGKVFFHYHQPFRYYFMFRNYIMLMKQAYIPVFIKLRYLIFLMFLLFKVIFLPNKIKYFKEAVKGIRDGIESNLGNL